MLAGTNKQLVKSAVGCALPVLQDFLLKKLPFWVQSNATTGLMCQLGTTMGPLLRNPSKMFPCRPFPCLLGDLARTGLGSVLCTCCASSFRECRTPIVCIVSWKFWKRMFHVCDFNGTILNFPDATDATKTYPMVLGQPVTPWRSWSSYAHGLDNESKNGIRWQIPVLHCSWISVHWCLRDIFGLILAQGSPGTNFADLYKMRTSRSGVISSYL